MKLARLTFLSVLLIGLNTNVAFTQETDMIGARHPSISPDGSQIAFGYMGDIWRVSRDGGRAFRLTDHKAYDREPVWSWDGEFIVFTSNRTGNDDVHLISADGGSARQLTYHTATDEGLDFSPDGKWIVFRSNRSSVSSLYKISVDGGNPLPLLDTYWSWPYEAKFHPIEEDVLISIGGESQSSWRRGYRGSNTSKLWIIPGDGKGGQKVVADTSNCYWPDWSHDGQTIYFVSDRQFNTKNVWRVDSDGSKPTPVTQYTEGDVRWLSVSAKSKWAVVDRHFGIWLIDLDSKALTKVSITAPAEPKENRRFFVDNGNVSEFQLSPDGKKIAAIVRGDIFVLSTKGGYARNVTNTPWRERELVWSKDSRRLVYKSDQNANPDIYSVSALGDEKPVRLTESDGDIWQPTFSPDGKWIAYYEGKQTLRLMKPDGSKNRILAKGEFGGFRADDISWSPDSRFISTMVIRNANQDLVLFDVESGEQTIITNSAYDENSPIWTPDGKSILFTANRFGHSFPEFSGKWDIYQVHLTPKPPEFEEDKFEKLFASSGVKKEKSDLKKKDNKGGKKSTPKLQIKLDDIDVQTERVTNTLGNDRSFIISPQDSSTVFFVSNIDGKAHLWKTSLKEKERGKYSPFVPNVTNLRQVQIDKKGKTLYYLANGKVGSIDINKKKNKSIKFSTRIEVDKTDDYTQMLGEVYYTLRHYFYDKDLHSADWKSIFENMLPVLQQVREDRDFYDYANEMIGYLNASHTGIRAPRGPRPKETTAQIGADFTFENGIVRINKILKNGPLYLHRDSVSVGDRVEAIDGKPILSHENFWKRLNGKPERRVRLIIKSQSIGRSVTIPIKPITRGKEDRLRLDEWIESRKSWVREKTDDQVAYVYMRAMGRGDLSRFLLELERDAVPRKGLILDLRYNWGGNVHDRVLTALTKPVYAKWQKRGLSETQQSTYGFADKPIVLITNEVTLSDGEMTASGFKSLKRGKIVGNTTYGWLIFTTSARLMNGGYFRLPFWGCYSLDGENLETSGGVTPDIMVINDLNHDLKGEDPQLDRAIEVLLMQLK